MSVIYDAIIKAVEILGTLILLDWAIPTIKVSDIHKEFFKRNDEEFYAAYSRGRPVRWAVALLLVVIVTVVRFFNEDLAIGFTVVPGVVGYIALIAYYMWCSEADRMPWA